MLQQHAQTEHFTPRGKTQIQRLKSKSGRKFMFIDLSIRYSLGQGPGDDLATIPAMCRRLKAQIQPQKTVCNNKICCVFSLYYPDGKSLEGKKAAGDSSNNRA